MMIESARERIYQAICDYVNANHRPISRQRLVQLTGFRFTVVDDHVKYLREVEGRVFVESPGYFQPASTFPPDRAMTASPLPDGMMKLELGDQEISFTPHEWQVLGSLAAGAARQLVDLQNERALQGQLARLSAVVKNQAKTMAQMTVRIARLQRGGHPDLFDQKPEKIPT